MMPVSAARRRRVLTELNQAAQVDLRNLWELAQDEDDFADFLVVRYPLIVDPYHQLAAQFAASWFEEADPGANLVGVPVDPLPELQLQSSARWALTATGDIALDRFSGTLQRSISSGARDTTALNARANNMRFVIEASPNACQWCQGFTDRDIEFITNDAAQRSLEGFHDNCGCQVVEVT